MNLIVDTGSHKCVLTESKTIPLTEKNSNILGVLEGVCSDFNVSTRNNNFYSKPLWEKVLKSDYYKEAIDTGTLIGELDHPPDRLEISAQEAAIRCTSLWLDEQENVLKGYFDILNTPKGQIVNSLAKAGVKLGVSSRGVGDLTPMNDGNNRVDEDSYLFVTFDAVVQPAAIKARQTYTALTESEKKNVNNILNTLIESINCANDSDGIKSIENIADRLQLKENVEFKKAYEINLNRLKNDESNNIIKKNDHLRKDLEEAYRKIQILESQTDKNTLAADMIFIKSQVSNIKKILDTSQNSLVSANQQTNDENSELREKAITLTNELKSSNFKYKKLSESLKLTQSKMKEKENQITELSKTVDYAVQFVEKCKSSFKSIESFNTKLTEQVTQSKELIKELKDEKDSIKAALKENNTKVRNSERLLESIRNEYLEQKCNEFGIDPSLAKSNINSVKSLKDIDLLITETIKVSNKVNQTQRPTVMSALKENKQVERNEIQNEDDSVVRQIFSHLKGTK